MASQGHRVRSEDSSPKPSPPPAHWRPERGEDTFGTTTARGPEPGVGRGRPLTRLSLAGMAAHVFLELGAGVGMPVASVVGPVPAAVLWAAGTAGTSHAARSRPASSDAAFAAVNTLGLAAVVAHLTGWPSRRSILGLPWLEDCEGLGPELMPLYNPILYFSGITAVGAMVLENRSGPRALPFLAAGVAPALILLQRWEFRRLQQQARTRPGWWNRRLWSA